MTGLGEMNWENGIKMRADLNFDFPVEENVLKALSVKVSGVIVNVFMNILCFTFSWN